MNKSAPNLEVSGTHTSMFGALEEDATIIIVDDASYTGLQMVFDLSDLFYKAKGKNFHVRFYVAGISNYAVTSINKVLSAIETRGSLTIIGHLKIPSAEEILRQISDSFRTFLMERFNATRDLNVQFATRTAHKFPDSTSYQYSWQKLESRGKEIRLFKANAPETKRYPE